MDRKEQIEKALPRSMTYREFRELMNDLHTEGKTTGKDQSEKQVNFSKLNARRMDRLEKRVPIENGSIHHLSVIEHPMLWLVISEAWCGDGAQVMPFIAKMADASANIELRVLLRDENPGLMDAFLTAGARSIPKLIILDAETKDVLGEWGPRPEPVRRMIADWKQDAKGKPYTDLQIEMQKWYNADKGRTVQEEILALPALTRPYRDISAA